MSKDKSKKWVISAPLFYNYAGILDLSLEKLRFLLVHVVFNKGDEAVEYMDEL